MTPIYYKEPIYRPPAEANSLLIQATEGCCYNCAFCIGNEGKNFLIRPIDAIKQDIINARLLYRDQVRKMFLLDGNAFVIKPETLIEIAEFSFENHKKLKRIGAYAHVRDVLVKSDAKLKAIADSGIKILYVGLETGDNELLQQINKKVTAEEIIKAAHKLYKAGITLSGTVILGLAGNDREASIKHAKETAKLINNLKPKNSAHWYISALTLMIPQGTVIHDKMTQKEFDPMTNMQILGELKVLLENLNDDLEKCIFRANHSSNYLPLESNNLARNRKELIETVSYALMNPQILRSELFRGL